MFFKNVIFQWHKKLETKMNWANLSNVRKVWHRLSLREDECDKFLLHPFESLMTLGRSLNLPAYFTYHFSITVMVIPRALKKNTHTYFLEWIITQCTLNRVSKRKGLKEVKEPAQISDVSPKMTRLLLHQNVPQLLPRSNIHTADWLPSWLWSLLVHVQTQK